MHRLRLVSLWIFALLASWCSYAAGRSDIVDFYTGNQLFDFCQRGSPACVGYILGVAAARSGDSFCFPSGVIGEQVVGTVAHW
jgi:Rap1a immunity proteins